jgi:hypothetical protein
MEAHLQSLINMEFVGMEMASGTKPQNAHGMLVLTLNVQDAMMTGIEQFRVEKCFSSHHLLQKLDFKPRTDDLLQNCLSPATGFD